MVEAIKFDPRNYRKHGDKNKKLIRKSLSELGAGRSILLDKDGVIVAGNGVYEQAKKLNIPVKIIETDGSHLIAVRRTDLEYDSPERQKLAIVDNSAGLTSEWENELLRTDISDEILRDLAVDIPIEKEEPEEEEYLKEEPEILQYNENVFFPSKNPYDIPELREDMLYDGKIDDICYGTADILDPENTYLCLYGQHAISQTATNNIVGFYVDDTRFEKVWNDAVAVLNTFKTVRPKALMTPNFSIWADEPKPYQLMAWYKTQWCGRYWQEAGFKIIPTLNWGTSKTYDFCFLGLPKNIPVVSIQCRNIKTKKEERQFLEGLWEAKSRLNFGTVYCYGNGISKFDKELKGIDYKIIRPWQDKKTEVKSN